MPDIMDFSTAKLKLNFKEDAGRFRLEHYGLQDHSWLHPDTVQKLFTVHIGGKCYDATNLHFVDLNVDYQVAGVQHLIARFTGDIEVEHHLKVYGDTALIETWQIIKNNKATQLYIERVDSFALDIPQDTYDLFYYTGNWGSEFEGKTVPLEKEISIDSRTGRSSKGHHPWFALTKDGGTVFSASVAWSGNWVCRFEPMAEGGFALSGGLHDWCFAKTLAPDATMETPPVIMVLGDDLNTV